VIHDIVAGHELSNVASTQIPTTQVINQTLHYIVIVETQYRRLAHMKHTVKVGEPAGKCTFKGLLLSAPYDLCDGVTDSQEQLSGVEVLPGCALRLVFAYSP
jgi:hypothetical protein